MKLKDSIFISYLFKMLKKWYYIFGLYLTAIELISRVVGKEISIPTNIVVITYVLGLFYSNYKVYKELVLSIPDEFRPEKPTVVLELVEGNSYQYGFAKRESNSDDELPKTHLMEVQDGKMPRGEITINSRIVNKSSNDIKITSINGSFNNFTENVFYNIMLPDIFSGNDKIKFPITIKRKSTFNFQYISHMHPANLTEAQIAVRTSKKDKMDTKFISKIDYIYGNNEEHIENLEVDISLRPFAEMLISFWEENKMVEIIELAKTM